MGPRTYGLELGSSRYSDHENATRCGTPLPPDRSPRYGYVIAREQGWVIAAAAIVGGLAFGEFLNWRARCRQHRHCEVQA